MSTGENDSKTLHVNLYKKKISISKRTGPDLWTIKNTAIGEAEAKLGWWGFQKLHNYDL